MSQLHRSSRALGMSFALLGFLGCQPLDSGATLGEPFTGETDGTGAALENPALELGDGRTASTGCEAVQLQAFDILERTCARCHGGDTAGARQGTPPFDCVLEPERMVSMISATAKDPEGLQPARILVPGDAAHSRLYLRTLHGEMPPPDVIGLPANPRPSVSDLSVLRHWIDSCMPAPDKGVDVDEHDTSAPDDHSPTH